MKDIRIVVTSILGLCTLLVSVSSAAEVGAAVSFSNIWAGKITPGSGNVGVDIWWPDHGMPQYNPCHAHKDANGAPYNDIYYGACAMANVERNSYYKVYHFGSYYSSLPGWSSTSGNDFPYGMFIDNSNPNTCKTSYWCPNPSATTINHGWANLVSGAAFEVYPQDSNGQYNPYTNNVGGVRVQVNSFPGLANGGRYSVNVGDISLPQLGQPNVGKLNGFITKNGVPAATDKVSIDVFQNGSSRSTSTGHPMSGFASVNNIGTEGYYSTGAVPSGSYQVYITDDLTGHKVKLDGVGINLPYERLDFKLDQHCFGFPNLNCQDPAQ